jgi:hypothetical protein
MDTLAVSSICRNAKLSEKRKTVERMNFMKSLIISGLIIFAELCDQRIARAQGTIYLSSLGPSTSTAQVGSDSWLAASFRSGNNPSGYLLDFIQLDMSTSSGNPSGFEVQLYNMTKMGSPLPIEPGSSLASLSGPNDPTSAGTYTFTASGTTLTPDTLYAIVVTATTPVANGSFAWGQENPSSNTSIDGWTEDGSTFESSDGSSWSENTINDPQFALTATAVPEPNTLDLLTLGGLFFAWRRWQTKVQPSIAK